MQFDILTLFPDLIHTYASESILGRAQVKKAISIRAHNYREHTSDKWGRVDDKPYGGGPGMVLQVEPVYNCLEKLKLVKKGKRVKDKKTKVIIMDPAGKKFDQALAKKYAKLDQLVIISGRYEGYDARIFKYVDERVSVGDYVLAGGELAALVITEATARLIPGVLGNEESLKEETHNDGQKEYPQYTRPENFMGHKVPKVLLSGDHKKIEEWRKKQQGV